MYFNFYEKMNRIRCGECGEMWRNVEKCGDVEGKK